MVIPTDDKQLIARVIDRDPGASDLFVERFYKFVWSVLVRDLGLMRERAEDLHQDVFLRLFEDDCRRLRNWSGDGSFVNYLGPIVRNLANDHFRRQNVRGEVSLEPRDNEDDSPSAMDPVSTDPGPDDLAAAAERRRLLCRAVEALSPRDQELIRRRHSEEQPYRQIADEMGYQISSVGVILARAEKRLKSVLIKLLEGTELASAI